MFSMLRTVFTLLILVVIVGFYLGWFSFTKSVPDPQSNKENVNISVDKQKIGADLKRLEQNVTQRIGQISSPPQGSAAPLSGRPLTAPGLNLGPITVQPSNQSGQVDNGQPGWSVGPFSAQVPSQPAAAPIAPPNVQPNGPPQNQDFQFTVPLGVPPGQR
jgi:hypothetical protein